MAEPKSPSHYALLSDAEKYTDADNDSDTIAGSITSLKKQSRSGSRGESRDTKCSSARRRRRCVQSALTWARWSLVVMLQSAILVLLLRKGEEAPPVSTIVDSDGMVESGSDINGIYKALSHNYTRLVLEPSVYMPNTSSDDERMIVRARWDALMPLGSGSVAIPDHKNYPHLGEPISDDPIRDGPLYEASWTHALHCLYYSVDTYHQLLVHGVTGEENPYHAAHCFEYLRTSILCNLDMTLEGEGSTMEGGGQMHVCKSREEAVKWIEDRRVDDLQDIVGP